MSTATIIGSGPNGLSAAIVLAASGVRTTVLERNEQIGGGYSTAEVTEPGFLHDLGSSTYPLGAASPFYRSLPFAIPWIQPHAAFAHPLDDGTAVVLEHSIEETIDGTMYKNDKDRGTLRVGRLRLGAFDLGRRLSS
jgi:phytoene dehydrogenase-like protein